MKIIYAPEYDGEKRLPLSAERPCLLDVTYVGNMGLLSQLELRLGISCESYTDIEREALLVRAIRLQKNNMFYPATKRDELGTAHKLLQWRDALLMAGWNPKTVQPSDKLSALAELEKNFSGKGVADRWLEVMHFATKMEYDLTGVDIAVETAEKYLPLVIRKTLQGVNAHGAKVTFRSHWEGRADKGSDLAQLQAYLCGGQLPNFQDDASLRVLRFNTPNEAYEWFVHLPEQSGRVAVNEDNELLNHVLSSWNLPLTHAECREGNPQITQLFKLGLSLFERPLNIYNLLSYLQIPLHPIPAMLRRKLADVICNEGGIGEQWHQAIEEFVFAEEEKEAKKICRKKSIFWEMVEHQNAQLDKEKLLAYNRALREWAQGLLHSDNEERQPDALTVHQLNALSTFCSTFALLMEEEETIDYKKLEDLVKSVYRPTHYVTSEAQQHGVTTLPDIAGLTAETGQLVWLDCVNKSAAGDAYDFLTMEERRRLNETGMEIPPYTEVLQAQREAMVRSLCRVEHELTVVTTAYEGNTQTNEHPFVAELKMLRGDNFTMETPEVDRKLQVELPTDWREPQGGYQLSGMEVPSRKQSNTSLTQLIHFPFNYVTEYIARLREPKLSELKDIKTTKGLVAHHFVDSLVKAAKMETGKGGKSTRAMMRQLFDMHHEEWIEKAIGETGTLLLLQENQFEKKTFILQLEKSTEALLTIMEDLNLEPVDCEVEIDIDQFFDYGGLNGSIDCLLQNAEGKYVIFDFKWSENREKYQHLIEQGVAMQLELYRWAVEQTKGPVAGMGYYLFPLCQLLTGDYADSGDVKHIDTSKAPAEPFIKRMKRSIAFRREQLKKGMIEESEELCFTDIDYALQMEKKQLLPLQVRYDDRKATKLEKMHKASPYVKSPLKNKNEEPNTNEIPTTHAILKARMK